MSDAYHLKVMGQGPTMGLGHDSPSMCQGPSDTEATPTPTPQATDGKALLVGLAIVNGNKCGRVHGKALLVGLVTHYVLSILFKTVKRFQQGLGKSMTCPC